MNLNNKKILVTGSFGFIGSNLVEKLKSLNAQVFNFDLEEGNDIQDAEKLEGVIKNKFDAIFHLAGISGSTESNQERLKSFKVNTIATVKLCELIVKHSPRTKLVLSSSRLEYGTPIYLPVDENHPTTPTSAYGLTKLAATQMSLIYHKKNNLNVTIFRTSNVYGPHKSDKFKGYNVVNNFIDKAKKNEVLTIFGSGNQKRDYIYIDDLTDAFILSLTRPLVSSGQIYNLGYGEGIEFKKMVNLIKKKVKKGQIKNMPWPQTYKGVETGSYISDISKIKSQLGFFPKIDFYQGLAKTIQNP